MVPNHYHYYLEDLSSSQQPHEIIIESPLRRPHRPKGVSRSQAESDLPVRLPVRGE